MAISGMHQAALKLINALGIDTKSLAVQRVVIDIDVRDCVKMYVKTLPTGDQVAAAAKVVETTHLDQDSQFAEFITVDAIDVDEKGNVIVARSKQS